MDEENLRREFVEFLTQYREEIARAACEAVPKAYPYMPSLAGSEETYEWILSELEGLIDAYSRDDAAALEYKGFYAYFVMYSADPFRAFFNYLDGMYFLARFTSSFAYDRMSVKGVHIRSQLKSFEGFVLRVLRGNTQYFLSHVLEPGLILDSLDPAVASALLPLQANQWGGASQKPLENYNLSEALTARERELCSLVAQGLSNKEIAASAGISVTTVKSHISNILAKLHLGNRTELALWFSQEGQE